MKDEKQDRVVQEIGESEETGGGEGNRVEGIVSDERIGELFNADAGRVPSQLTPYCMYMYSKG